MSTALLNSVSRFLSLSWLTGPIFDKELRVSSRRKRNYVLRFVYLALLTIFLVLVWVEQVRYSGSAAYRMSRMARAGQTITVFIIWFQFCTTLLIAVIMLSTSISDEIYHKTLGVLMTTPINSFQIVMGKLFSKLLQLILLLAISLPLLAIVRVFGGVPWAYVIKSLCIILSTIIFVGSLSLFFSIFNRKAYVVIIITILVLAVLFGLLPLLTVMSWYILDLKTIVSEDTMFTALANLNPFFALFFATEMMFNPRSLAGMPTLIWPLNCGIMLAGSAFVLALSVIKVRKIALRQAVGQLGKSFRKKKNKKNTKKQGSTTISKTVKGPPILWKEMRFPLLGKRKTITFIMTGIGVLLLLITYFLCAVEGELDNEITHVLYVSIFMALGLLFTIILPATSITSEKESRCWPLLMATTLSDWQILFGKFIGTVRRCLPIWALLFGHIIVFSACFLIHPVAILQMAILVAWIIVFLSCTGIYFSSRFKHTTTAVVMNFALAAVIWGLIPLLMALITGISSMNDDLLEGYITTIPFVQAAVVMDGTVDGWTSIGTYNWIDWRLNAWESTLFMLTFMVGYMFLGFLFACAAKRRFRRNIF